MSASADRRGSRRAWLAVAGTALLVVGIVLALTGPFAPSRSDAGSPTAAHPRERAVPSASRAALPPVGHVFVVNIENKGFAQTWGAGSAAPYLARRLRARGVLLTQYFGTAHHSLGNYLAQISGQGPDYATQHDCPVYTPFKVTRKAQSPQQVVGNGCVYPASVGTLPQQLVGSGRDWRGYMEDMATPCQHSALGARERWSSATRSEQYATRHNPFMYFASITGRTAYCKAHVRPLSALTTDLQHASTTRSLSYITPDLCHDGHDASCANGEPGGLAGVQQWMRTWIPKILRSPAFQKNGLLVITADESEGPTEDSRACCGEGAGPNAGRPGIDGPGGGRIGALLISPFIKAGTTSNRAYNHYSLLGSIEDLFGVPRLGYAQTVTHVFGSDVYASR